MTAYCERIEISDRIYIKKRHTSVSKVKAACTYHLPDDKFFVSYISTDTDISIPANAYHKLTYSEVLDKRKFQPLAKPLKFLGELRPEQQELVDRVTRDKNRAVSGIIQCPCGWGKTYTATSLIAKTSVPTLILVHTKLLQRQWISEIKSQLGVEPGIIGDGEFDVKPITVAIYKTAYNRISDIRDYFSMCIVDEAHMCPAETFSQVVNSLTCKVKIGLTATPKRRDGKHLLFEDYFGPKIFRAKEERELATPRVAVVLTDIVFNPRIPQRDWVREVSNLSNNSDYHKLITEHAIADCSKNRVILILGERLAFLDTLNKLIPKSVMLVGKTPEDERQKILSKAGKDYKVILSTKIFDEGVSCHRLDTLYLTMPSSNTIKLEQRIGRIVREHPDKNYPLIKDFWLRGMIINNQQNHRKSWYKQQGYSVGNV